MLMLMMVMVMMMMLMMLVVVVVVVVWWWYKCYKNYIHDNVTVHSQLRRAPRRKFIFNILRFEGVY